MEIFAICLIILALICDFFNSKLLKRLEKQIDTNQKDIESLRIQQSKIRIELTDLQRVKRPSNLYKEIIS
jgi:chaperonin cofactor prefoldin